MYITASSIAYKTVAAQISRLRDLCRSNTQDITTQEDIKSQHHPHIEMVYLHSPFLMKLFDSVTVKRTPDIPSLLCQPNNPQTKQGLKLSPHRS
jgi:hypothetical protein